MRMIQLGANRAAFKEQDQQPPSSWAAARLGNRTTLVDWDENWYTHIIQQALAKRWRSLLPYAALLLLCLTAGLLLFLAYPMGIVTPETIAYFYAPRNFHWFTPNFEDWRRTPVFGLVFLLASLTGHTGQAVFWLTIWLFAADVLLIYHVAARVLRSSRDGWWLACTLAVFEIVTMRLFYYGTQMATDAVLGHLMFIGIMLILSGWLHRGEKQAFVGYALLGIAAVVRPVGIALFPIGILLSFFVFRRSEGTRRLRNEACSIALALGLLLAPTFAISTRNAAVYGVFQSTALGPHELLSEVLILVKDTDRVFDDPALNQRFLQALRDFERSAGQSHTAYAWSGTWDRPGPFEFLGKMTPLYAQKGKDFSWDEQSTFHFQVAPLAKELALRIIKQHPVEWVSLVARNYSMLFSPYHTWQAPGESFSGDPTVAYKETLQFSGASELVREFYPPDGTPNFAAPWQGLATVMHGICCTVLQRFFFSLPSHFGAVFGHLVWFGGTCLFLYLARRKPHDGSQPHWRELAVVTTVLFASASGIYLLTAMCETALYRYSIAGLIEVHTVEFLTLFAVGHFLFHARDSTSGAISDVEDLGCEKG